MQTEVYEFVEPTKNETIPKELQFSFEAEPAIIPYHLQGKTTCSWQ